MLKQQQLTQRNTSRIQTTRVQPVQMQQHLISSLTNPSKRYRSFCKSFASASLISLSGIAIGFGLAQTSPIAPQTLTDRWNLSFSGAICSTLLIGIPTIASIIGASLTKATIKFLSRKLSLVVGCITIIIGSLLMLIPYQQGLIIGRFIEGVGIGYQMGITGIYLKEISPKQLRSLIAPLISIGITLGSLLCYFISAMMTLGGLSLNNQASILVAFNGVYAVIQIIGLLTFVPNSPFQQVTKGNQQQAREILKQIYKDKYIQTQLDQIKLQIQISRKRNQALAKGQSTEEQLLFNKKAGKARLVAIVICCYRQLNGGVSALTFIGPLFAVIAAKDPRFSAQLIQYVPLISTLVSFLGNVLGVFVIANRFGRRTLLVLSAVLLTITNIGSGISMEFYSPLAFFILILIEMLVYGAFALAPGWTYPNEVVPPQKVALQNSLTSFALAIAVFLNPILYYLLPENNAFPLFYIYGAVNIIGFFVYSLAMVQSKGRTFKQIIQLY